MAPPRDPARRFLALLVPSRPRHVPGQRAIKILLRGAHVLCTGIFVGGLWFAVAAEARAPWFHAALLSGLALLALDLFETGAFLFQLRGLVVLVKLALLAAVPVLGASAPWVLGVVVVGSVVSSHAPSGFRYFLVWGRGKIVGAETKG